MEVLSIKKYNIMRVRCWRKLYEKVLSQIDMGKRSETELPQLDFYIFYKNYGYVAFDHSQPNDKALWNKTKKGAIAQWESEELVKA